MATKTAPPKRRRLRIRLRLLMLLVLVAGVWMGSLVNKARKEREDVAAVKQYEGSVHFDWEFVNGNLTTVTQPHASRGLMVEKAPG